MPFRFSWSIPAPMLVDPLLWGLLLGAVLLWRLGKGPSSPRARRGRRALWALWLVACITSTPAFSNALLWILEPWPRDLGPALAAAPPERTALVVLAAGMYGPPWLPRVERLNGSSMARALGAGRVYREHPGKFGAVFVTGRSPGSADTADAMADALAFGGVPRDHIVLEPASESTRASAEAMSRLLRERGITRVVVVTSAVHMRRTQAEFERAGVPTLAAPVDHHARPLTGLDMFVPDAQAFGRLDPLLHELAGRWKP
jgi:uncharacterized SAM-binding protein YcdF (DUF218 family)